jgi:hypothetical protein
MATSQVNPVTQLHPTDRRTAQVAANLGTFCHQSLVMDGQEASGVTGKEELVSSWQDLRGRNLLTGEHRWESIAGGRHADVVPLDGGMEAFSGLSCIKTDDHQAVGFMTGTDTVPLLTRVL